MSNKSKTGKTINIQFDDFSSPEVARQFSEAVNNNPEAGQILAALAAALLRKPGDKGNVGVRVPEVKATVVSGEDIKWRLARDKRVADREKASNKS